MGSRRKQGYELSSLSRSQIEFLIDEWVLNEKYRGIIKRRLLDGVTYENLAEEFGYSTRQIKNIVYKLENKLYCRMK